MATLLQAEYISRVLPGGRVLLDALSVTIGAGERVGLRGPAGSGKTLLLRALALLDPVNDGRILWRGAPIPDEMVPSFRRRVAYLPQTPALVSGTVEVNLRLPFTFGIYQDSSYVRERAEDLLDRLGLETSFLDQSVTNLSGGERQLAALVRQLQVGPRILLLDEPTAALDSDSRTRVQELISAWVEADGERAFLWVSHDDRQVDSVADRHLRIAAGALQ